MSHPTPLAALADARYDLLVIGAGINGAAIARDAAMRGMTVLVLDKDDIAAGTTSWSTRLIHGGLRYLEHREFGLVRESLRERELLLRNAPHLVAPLPLVLPIYAGASRGPQMIRLGMLLYDVLSYDKTLPRHRMFGRDETLRRLPGLDPDGLRASARYYDAQITFPERITVELIRSAAAHGAIVRTRARVARLLASGTTVQGVVAVDVDTGEEAALHARAVINVAGPWVDAVLAGAPGDAVPQRQIGGTRGSHIVVRDFPGAPTDALYVEARSDGRPFFIVPWNNTLLIGTTDIRHDGDLDDVRATADEVRYLVDETNLRFPGAGLTVEQVAYVYSGVRPLPYKASGSTAAITRSHIVRSHAPRLAGLWSVIGGKLTTHRQLAEHAVDAIAAAQGAKAPCRTRDAAFPGAAGIAPDAFLAALQRESALPAATIARLGRIYGAIAREIVDLATATPALGETIDPATGAIAAEIVHAVRTEAAVTLEDILMRRTMLGLEPGMAAGVDQRAVAVAQAHLGWSADRAASELAAWDRHRARFHASPEPGSR
jgi:glycerol-3-phosphate dehydrogenase